MTFSIGLIGYGHFGAFLHVLAERFLPEAPLKIYSGRRVPDGTLYFPLEDVAACDVVVLCVPISAYEAMLDRVAPHLGATSVLVDVATIKKYTTELLEAKRAPYPFIATHPMFGPESYARRGKDVGGLRIVITGHNLEPETYAKTTGRLREAGFTIVEKTPDAHDRDLAETLFLTHYVGQVIAHGGFQRTDIDTVSFGYLMDAVDSVRHDGQLFEEVCRYNPYCRDVIDRFDRSDQDVRERLLRVGTPKRPSLTAANE